MDAASVSQVDLDPNYAPTQNTISKPRFVRHTSCKTDGLSTGNATRDQPTTRWDGPPAEPGSTATSRRVRSWTELLLLEDFPSKRMNPADATTRLHRRTKRGEKILRLARERYTLRIFPIYGRPQRRSGTAPSPSVGSVETVSDES